MKSDKKNMQKRGDTLLEFYLGQNQVDKQEGMSKNG